MKLTWEESTAARKILDEHPRQVPVELLSRELCQRHFERVARAAAMYNLRQLPNALEFYVLGLMQSNQPDDLGLAKRMLEDAERKQTGLFSKYSASSFVQAANWICRFDLDRWRYRTDMDLSLRLRKMAELVSLLSSPGVDEKISSLLDGSLGNCFDESDVRGLYALHLIQSKEPIRAFWTLKNALKRDKENPYLRMACHELYRDVPDSRRTTVLYYTEGRAPVSLGVAGIPGAGVLCKHYTGEGYRRDESHTLRDNNYSQIHLIATEQLQNEAKAGRLKLAEGIAWGEWVSRLEP